MKVHNTRLEIISPTGQDLHLFDAKFKLERLDVLLSEDDESIERERRGTFTREDLYKMHTYRDAITAARSAWVLYPGTEARFFHIEHSASIWTGLDVLPDTFAGVGVVPLVPGDGDHTMLSRILKAILMRARISTMNG